jgi:hypothetical protein
VTMRCQRIAARIRRGARGVDAARATAERRASRAPMACVRGAAIGTVREATA